MSKLKLLKHFFLMALLFGAMATFFVACEEPDEPEKPNEVYYD
jgi:hypothetical protein